MKACSVESRLIASFGLLALVSACTASVGPPPPVPPPVGTAIADWTIDGTKDPARCQASGAATFHITLFSASDRSVGDWVQDCTAFATTIGGLFPDTYTGKAELLDADGRPRTTSVNLAPFGVIGDASVVVNVDFPADSFF
jgi:hypothetical protein